MSFGERDDGTQPLKITLRIGEDEGYVLDRLRREKRVGTLTQLSETMYSLDLDVADASETLPWVKTFIGRIVKLEGGSERAREVFLNDIARMNAMYNGDKL